MTVAVARLALTRLGTRGPDVAYSVVDEAIRAYAQATDAPSLAALAGHTATPVFAIRPVWEAINRSSRALAGDEAWVARPISRAPSSFSRHVHPTT